MKTTLLALVAMAGLLAVPSAQAQDGGDPRSGTAAMEQLLVPVTARTISLGSAFTASLADANAVEASQSNPAAITTNQSTALLFSRTQYFADTGINFAGVAQTFGANSVALTLTSWDWGNMIRTTVDAPENGSLTWTASTVIIGGTYARQLTDRIAAGVTLKGLSETIDQSSAQGIAFDAGITYAVPESGLRFGVALKNFGNAMSFSGGGLNRPLPTTGPGGTGEIAGGIIASEGELPSLLSFGASYNRQFAGDLSATVLANYRSNSYDMDQFAAGVEIGYANLLYVRGGLDLTTEPSMRAQEIYNLGAGLNLPLGTSRLNIDYAFQPASFLGSINMFTLGFNL
ncbi:MAG: PorV/PorQ family protein [Rubricoccaceae bacterium]